jgi:hypothetical protein
MCIMITTLLSSYVRDWSLHICYLVHFQRAKCAVVLPLCLLVVYLCELSQMECIGRQN